MSEFIYDLPRGNVARTRPVPPDLAQRYLDAARRVAAPCEPAQRLEVRAAPSPPDPAPFDLADGPSTVHLELELGPLARPRHPASRRALSDGQLDDAIGFFECLGAIAPNPDLMVMVALPTPPPFDPTNYGDAMVTIGTHRHAPPPGPGWPPHRYPFCSITLTTHLDHRGPRLGAELAAEHDRALAALGLSDALRVGVDGDGRAALRVLDPHTLFIPTYNHAPDEPDPAALAIAALDRGRRVVKARRTWDGRDFPGLDVIDPAAPFTVDHVRRVLGAWAGRVYDVWVSAWLSAAAYAGLRARLARDGDPFGRWDAEFFVRGLRDVAALGALGGRTGRSFGVGTVTTPTGERVALTVRREVRAFRVVAHGHALDTDVGAVLGRAIGDPGAVEARR